jgi:hypothetical protein
MNRGDLFIHCPRQTRLRLQHAHPAAQPGVITPTVLRDLLTRQRHGLPGHPHLLSRDAQLEERLHFQFHLLLQIPRPQLFLTKRRLHFRAPRLSASPVKYRHSNRNSHGVSSRRTGRAHRQRTEIRVAGQRRKALRPDRRVIQPQPLRAWCAP